MAAKVFLSVEAMSKMKHELNEHQNLIGMLGIGAALKRSLLESVTTMRKILEQARVEPVLQEGGKQ